MGWRERGVGLWIGLLLWLAQYIIRCRSVSSSPGDERVYRAIGAILPHALSDMGVPRRLILRSVGFRSLLLFGGFCVALLAACVAMSLNRLKQPRHVAG